MASNELVSDIAFSEKTCSDTGELLYPFVTVIVPCRNEERHIEECLDSILANDYPWGRWEVLVVDAMSEDRTREIVRAYAGRDSRVRLLDNPKKHIPTAMNLGIRQGRGDVIIKMDAHSTYRPDHISQCIRFQQEYGAENVGGVCRICPGSDTAVAQAIVWAIAHHFGSGNAKIKVGTDRPTWSDSAAFGCFRKGLFERIGWFDERLKSNSDMDMNVRIRAAGGGILIVPEIVISYRADATFGKFWQHNFADGVWTTYVLRFNRKAWSLRHLVPLAFVLSLLGSAILAVFAPLFMWLGLGLAGLYSGVSAAVALQVAFRENDIKQLFLLPAALAVRHFAHGVGALFGLVLLLLPGVEWKGRREFQG